MMREPMGRRGRSSRPTTTPSTARMPARLISSAGLSAVPSASMVASRTAAGARSTTESATARKGDDPGATSPAIA